MSRRTILKGALAAGGASLLPQLGCQSLPAAPRSRPNVIVFLSDDQGYGDMSLYGNEHISTPHLERLAQRGVMMDQFYSGCPLCAPARASLLTGRYNHRTGALCVESNRGMDRIALREQTIADTFKAGGYRTGMIGKWHNGLFDKRHLPYNRGFDEFAGFLNGGMDYYDWILDYNGTPRHSDGRYLTDVFTDEAVSFIRRHRENPFFLYVAYNAPHSPLQAPQHLVDKYAQTGKFHKTVSTIYAMIEQMDAGVGRVMDTLEELGLDENTIIIFTSDNGPWLGSGGEDDYMRYNGPFSGMKNWVLEGGIRVPGIFSWPAGLPSGNKCHEMTHFNDIMPTVLSACGISDRPKQPLDGVDILPMLRGEAHFEQRKLYWQHNRNEPIAHCNSAMRDGPWKLVWPYPKEARYKSDQDNAWYFDQFKRPHFDWDITYAMHTQDVPLAENPQLFNLDDDPAEQHDLAEVHPDRFHRMRQELDNWFEQVEADRHSIGINFATL